MRRTSLWLAVLCTMMLALPGLADARVGNGGSFGSRGGRTYSAPPPTNTAPGGASQMQRSTTMPNPGYGTGAAGVGGYGGGYGRSHFGSGILGGLLGFGLGSALFGHGFGGGYGAGGFGILGLLIKLAILFFVIRWLFRMFTRRSGGSTSMFGGGGMGGLFGAAPAIGPVGYGASAQAASQPVAVMAADYTAFEVLLKNIQAAWSNSDLNAMRNFATPEMVSVFAEQLAGNASSGRRNVVSDVVLQKGDLSEAWSEGSRTYATVAMRISMIDVTYDPSGRVIDGSPTEHVTATEFWTFMRADGGRWILSAIQQGR